MKKYLVSLVDLPADGKEFTLDDQEIWLEPLREFKMDYRVTSPLVSRMKILPAENGCLIRATLEGSVTVPCNRCAEDADIAINSGYEEFEEIPEEPGRGHHGGDSESHVVFEKHVPMLNLADVAWEQLMLAMPVSPLCKSDCKGLCPSCGANLNLGDCGCEKDDSDPRMAPLRNLKVD